MDFKSGLGNTVMGLLKLYPFYGCNNSGIFIWAGTQLSGQNLKTALVPSLTGVTLGGILFHIGNILDWRRGMLGIQTDLSKH